MVRKVVRGYHSTIFAYGQTGSGKTYTMEGYRYRVTEKGTYQPLIQEAVEADSLGIV